MNIERPNFQVGDWVVVMSYHLVPLNIDASTWDGIPGIIKEIKEDRVNIESPLKICHGRPSLDNVPFCQLIKISETEGQRYVNCVIATDTYEITRTRCST